MGDEDPYCIGKNSEQIFYGFEENILLNGFGNIFFGITVQDVAMGVRCTRHIVSDRSE